MGLGSARYYKEYRNNEVSTSSQGQLILMMYDGAIKNARLALHCMEKKDISGRGTHIRKAHSIISELSLSLDQGKGQQVAKQLENLYQFMMKQLTLANIKGAPEPIESVLNIMRTLQEGWEEVIKKVNADGSPKPQPAKSITSHC